MEQFINTLDGELNTDDELTDVPASDFIDSINTRRPPGLGGRVAMNGNVDLGYALPGVALDTDFLGSCEDHFKKTMVFFVKNATADRIVRYWPEEARFDELIIGGPLNFDNPIHSAVVVDGKYLIWTDGRSDNGVITGNPPRMIDMDKASLYQKKLTYELHTNNAGLTGTYALTITQLNGTVVTGPTVFYTGTGLGVEPQLDLMVTALAGLGVTATRCGDRLELEVDTAERRAIITSTSSDIVFVGINHYPATIIEPYISLARYMPKCAPEPVFYNDPSIDENNLFGFSFKFRYRYLYRDGYKSKWSPISYMPSNFTDDGTIQKNDEGYNAIRLLFDDSVISDPSWRSFIQSVEIAVSIDNGLWKSAAVLHLSELNFPGISPSLYYKFLNNSIYSVVPSDESSASASDQALGNFEFTPKISGSVESISDDKGNYAIALYGNLEGNEMPSCADATIATRSTTVDAPPASVATAQSQTSRKLKENGIYDIYVIYEDDYGRQWPAMNLGRFYCQVGAGAVGLRSVPQVTINHLPPVEATRYRLGISSNLNQAQYIQFIMNRRPNASYWKKQADGTFAATTYGAGDADYVGFIVAPISDFDPVDGGNNIFDDIKRSMLAQDGDRVQVYGTAPTGGASGNYRVAGYNLTWPTGTSTIDYYTIFVEFDSSQPDHTITDVNEAPVVELYRRSTVDPLVIHELPECYDIVNPGTPTRNHGGMKEILFGDTFEIEVETDVANFTAKAITTVETDRLYEYRNVKSDDWGRTCVEDPDYREIFQYNQLRPSGIFIPDTAINGLPSFKGLDYIRVSRDIGLGQRLEYVKSVLLAIGQFGTHPVYVGSDQVIDFRGNSLVGISNSLLNLAPDVLMYGTHDPLSIINTGQYVFGWDGYMGVPWRYSVGGGIDDISRKNKKLFNAISKEYFDDRDTLIVRGGLQREFGGFYYLTFRDAGLGYNNTLVFSIDRGMWDGRCSFAPELYGSVGLNFYAFNIAKVWEQDGGSPGTFFGGRTGNEPELTIVVNPSPASQKLFWNMDEQADALWWSPEITIEDSVPGGMMTRIKQARWKRYEGHWYAEIPRDMNDPDPSFTGITGPVQALNSGRHMRGDAMVVKLRLDDSTILSKLRSVKTGYSKS